MIQVKRLGHATFTTPDLEEQIAYWTEVIGLRTLVTHSYFRVQDERLWKAATIDLPPVVTAISEYLAASAE